MKLRALLVLICVSTGAGLRADVTAQYNSTIQMASFLPGMDQALKDAQSAMPSSAVLRMKGTKLYSKYGRMESITDLAKQELTLYDVASKTYATAPYSQAMEKMTGVMPEIPGDAGKMLQSMKASFEAKKTGLTETILGIQGEETDGVLTVEGPAMPGMPPGPLMKMVVRIWVARPEESLRLPALRELTGYTQFSANLLNTGEMMKKMMGKIPGFGDGIDSMYQELQKSKSVTLRTRMEVQMPMMAQLAQQMAKAGQPLPAGFDPNAPFMQMNQELVELSDAPLDEAMFQVPGGFRQVTFEELVKAMIPQAATPGATQ